MRLGLLGLVASAFLFVAASLSTPASADALKPINFCTGGQSGNYYKVGQIIAGQTDNGIINVIETRGSWENLQKLADGSCDAILVQSDAPEIFKNDNPKPLPLRRVGALYSEYVHIICNVNSGIEKLSNLTNKNTIIVGQDGSGSYVTWRNFIKQNKAYADVQTTPGGGDDDNMLQLQDGHDAQCMLFVTGINSQRVLSLAGSADKKMRLVDINDSDVTDLKNKDGEDVYTYAKIENYDGFEGRWSKVKTVALNAVLYVNKDWVNAHPAEYAKFTKAVVAAKPTIKNQLGDLAGQ